MNQKHNSGFTLVELVIAMATGTLVFIAASTLLLLGLRINNLTTATTIQQNDVRTIITMMERLASDGKISKVTYDGDSWNIETSSNTAIKYDANAQALLVGNFDAEGKAITTPILKNVYASHAVLDEKQVLTFAVETDQGSYRSSVYCRMASIELVDETDKTIKDEIGDIFDNEDKEQVDQRELERQAFLDVLYGQYRLAGGGVNSGVILNDAKRSTGEYYSEWYINTVGGSYGVNGWNKNTPWCACYISWALSQVDRGYFEDNAVVPIYANVDNFIEYFKGKSSLVSTPTPGDIIFFDWTGGDNPAHVGVVIKSDDTNVYTIEGNSAGIIALRSYSLSDNRIIGYGVLPWK